VIVQPCLVSSPEDVEDDVGSSPSNTTLSRTLQDFFVSLKERSRLGVE
jgi:hypothetical protein